MLIFFFSLRSSADAESFPVLFAQVAEHQKKLAAIPDHVKVSKPEAEELFKNNDQIINNNNHLN